MFDGIKSGNVLLKNIHFFKVYHIIKVLKEVLYGTQNQKKNNNLGFTMVLPILMQIHLKMHAFFSMSKLKQCFQSPQEVPKGEKNAFWHFTL